jgi:hypothetical protein
MPQKRKTTTAQQAAGKPTEAAIPNLGSFFRAPATQYPKSASQIKKK